MTNPATEPFLGSKTMVLICLGMGFSLLLIGIGAVVQVVFDQNIWQGVMGGLGTNALQTSAGVYRNVQVDGVVRTQMALNAPPIDPRSEV